MPQEGSVLIRSAKTLRTAVFQILADEIKSLAKRSGLEVLSFAPSAVKKAICSYGWATKTDVAKAVIARFQGPQMERTVPR